MRPFLCTKWAMLTYSESEVMTGELYSLVIHIQVQVAP